MQTTHDVMMSRMHGQTRTIDYCPCIIAIVNGDYPRRKI